MRSLSDWSRVALWIALIGGIALADGNVLQPPAGKKSVSSPASPALDPLALKFGKQCAVSCETNVQLTAVYNEKGECVPSQSQPCTPYLCDAKSKTCGGSCEDDAGCQDGYLCDKQKKSCVLNRKGYECSRSCTNDSVTVVLFDEHNHCAIQDVRSCFPYACHTAKKENGTGAVFGGTGGTAPKAETTGCLSACSQDWECSGGAVCSTGLSESKLFTGVCMLPVAHCVANEEWLGSKTLPCHPYICSVNHCLSSCVADTQCVSGNKCVDHQCVKK